MNKTKGVMILPLTFALCFKYDSASITRHHTLGEPEFK